MPGILALEIHSEEAPPDWDDALRAGGGVVFHSRAWASYKVQENGGEPLFCVWRQGEEVIGRALAMRKPPRSSRIGRHAAKLVFDSPPAGAAGDDFVAPLLDWCRRDRAVTEVALGTFDALGPWLPGELPGRRARCEFVLPAGDADDVWVQMRQLARRKVKRAQKAELSVRLAPAAAGVGEFADVYAVTEARLRQSKESYRGVGFDRGSFAAALADLLGSGAGRLYGAFRGEDLEAGIVFTTFGERAYMIYSGATDPGREIGGPFLAMAEALRDLREDGYRTINLGGAAGDAADPASSEHGLYQFKTRFGAEVVELASGTLVPRPLRAKLVGAARRVVRS
ncbi:MAG: lipid II:glycine glycyltransferase FemX [Solirubrobacterales bacterium]